MARLLAKKTKIPQTKGTSPPLAECGCAVPTAAAAGVSTGQTDNILDADLWAATVSKCSRTNCSASVNAAPFCDAMATAPRTQKALMYARNVPGCSGKKAARKFGGPFDLISTYSPTGWPNGTDPATQGAPAPLGTCPNGGVYTMCFSTGCLLKEAYNGMPVTCYCPIYTTTEPFVFPNGTGFSCTGESVGGTLRYVQSGCQYGCA